MPKIHSSINKGKVSATTLADKTSAAQMIRLCKNLNIVLFPDLNSDINNLIVIGIYFCVNRKLAASARGDIHT